MTAFKVKVVIPARNEALSIAKVVSSVTDQVDQVIIIVFMDGDAADDPEDLQALLNPIRTGEVAFTLGSRLTGTIETGALTLPQKFGNSLACFLMKMIWGGQFTDLGPFRAIRRDTLESLNMKAETFGDFIGCRFGRMVYSHDDIRGSCKANAQRLVITKAII